MGRVLKSIGYTSLFPVCHLCPSPHLLPTFFIPFHRLLLQLPPLIYSVRLDPLGSPGNYLFLTEDRVGVGVLHLSGLKL